MSGKDIVLRGGLVLRCGKDIPERLDVRIGSEGLIREITPDISTGGADVLDISGQLVLPGLVDVHQHLDKSRTACLVSNSGGTLDGAIAAFKTIAPTITRAEMTARASRTIAECSSYGTVAIRSHTNIDPEIELRAIDAMIEVREQNRDRMHIELVAHLTGGAPSLLDRSRDWIDRAVAMGADIIGGVPAYSDRPRDFLKLLFDCASRHGCQLDMHIDEHLDADRVVFDTLIELTRAHGMSGRVVASHCSALSAMSSDDSWRIIEGFRDAGIGVVTLPAANLFLQGRSADRLAPRGLTRVSELAKSGVRIAAASDNIQDPFIPTGSGDLLEIARWTLLAGHLGFDDFTRAFAMISSMPAGMMQMGTDWGIQIGNRADLLIARATGIQELVAGGARDRTVIFGGRIVSTTQSTAYN